VVVLLGIVVLLSFLNANRFLIRKSSEARQERSFNMDKVDISRYVARVETCRRELAKAKHDLAFWSRELRLAVDVLAEDKQLDFAEVLS